jgi:hypothetical protein
MGAQGLGQRRNSPDLSVDLQDYFGADPREIDNSALYGLTRGTDADLYRVEYLFLAVFGNDAEDEEGEYGGAQVRSSAYLYLVDGAVPTDLQRVMQRIAHRGAFLFDSSIEEPIYGSGGGDWADGGGYLTGFTMWESGASYRNWEVEPVGSAEGRPRGVTPGKIEWTTELYLEVSSSDPKQKSDYAQLSGVGQGVANPWTLDVSRTPPREGVEAQQEWWRIGDTINEARNAYQIAPPGRTQSRERAKELSGKTVYVNGTPIGTVIQDGRVFLKREYAAGPSYRGDYSREGLISQTPATPSALAKGRKIAKVDESPGAVYLATAQARPESFDPVDPDEVDPDRRVQRGQPGGTTRTVGLREPESPTLQECRQDQQVIRHLGYSSPVYTHEYAEMWKWPGFRSIEERGHIERPADRREDGQTGLDDATEGDDA